MRGPEIEERLLRRIADASRRLTELDDQLSDPEVARDPERLRTLGQGRAQTAPVVEAGRTLAQLREELDVMVRDIKRIDSSFNFQIDDPESQ